MSYVETIVVLVPTESKGSPWAGEVETPLEEPDLSVAEAMEKAQELARKLNMRAHRIRQVRKPETWIDTVLEGIGTLALVALVILAL